MNQKVVTFGEIMLRLKSPGYERFFQSPALEATFGGSEANVSVSLANYGMDTAFVTVLPDHEIGDACLRELRGFGVDTSKIVRREGRMGVYYLETGAVQRPSKVIYDREGSVFCNARPGDFDWNSVFEGASWFHITGITPAVSEGAAELSLEAVREAKKRGLQVSCDLNYRSNLWKYGKTPEQVMVPLVRYVDTLIANEGHFRTMLGLRTDEVETGTAGAMNNAAPLPIWPWKPILTSGGCCSRSGNLSAPAITTGTPCCITARSCSIPGSTPLRTSWIGSAAATVSTRV